MSKLIVAFHRHAPDIAEAERRARRCLSEITPDIFRAGARIETRIETRTEAAGAGHQVQAVLNLPDSSLRSGMSLCQGRILGSRAGWAEPGAPLPDGSYALIRDDARHLEAATDPTAGRSLWVYFDEDLFVVSNSQRAATLYAGRFEFDPEVVPWILATGALGLGQSYSRLLRPLPPASRAMLDKAAWQLRWTEGAGPFVPRPDLVAAPSAARREALGAALREALADFEPEDAPRMSLSLSGGADSRAVAALLPRGTRWRSVSGGPAGSQHLVDTDAGAAGQVAAALGFEHRFVPVFASPEPIETVIMRFVLASEGRVDHLEGYLDGLAHHGALAADGTEALIRGDTSLGGPAFQPADSELAARATIGLVTCRDMASLAPRAEAFGLAGQSLPEALARSPGESLVTWRDRTYPRFRGTVVLSALTETKTYGLEVVNPLLSRRLWEVVAALSDAERLDKALFRAVMREIAPRLFAPDPPYARRHGGPVMVSVLRRPGARRLIEASLDSEVARKVFGAPLLDWIGDRVSPAEELRSRARRAFTRLTGIRPTRPDPTGLDPTLDVHPLRLAFRVHMTRVMIEQLTADAALLAPACAPAAA